MPRVKSKKKKLKKELPGGAEVAMEMETEEGTHSRDPLTPEPGDPAPQKKKRKKRTPTTDQDPDNPDVANGNADEAAADGDDVNATATRRTKRKRKVKAADHHGNELEDQDEGMMSDGQAPPPLAPPLFSAPYSQPGRGPAGRTRHFQAERVDQLRHSELMNDYVEPRQTWTTREVAMKVHSTFRVLGLFCHGFLAGFAVWNTIVVYQLAGEQLSALSNLLQQYQKLAQPAQSLLYLLLAISTVSAFDRLNLAKASMALRGFLRLDPAALASFLYFIALILSLSQQTTSDRISLYQPANQTLWPPRAEQQVLRPWMVVNLVVALLVGVAWVVVSTRPNTDYTEDFLMTMEVDGFPRAADSLDFPA